MMEMGETEFNRWRVRVTTEKSGGRPGRIPNDRCSVSFPSAFAYCRFNDVRVDILQKSLALSARRIHTLPTKKKSAHKHTDAQNKN